MKTIFHVRFQISLKSSVSHPDCFVVGTQNFLQENLRAPINVFPAGQKIVQLGAVLSSSGVFTLRPKGRLPGQRSERGICPRGRPRRREWGQLRNQSGAPQLQDSAQPQPAILPGRSPKKPGFFSVSISSWPLLSYLTSSRSRRKEKGENKRKPLHHSDSQFTCTGAKLAFFLNVTFSPACLSTNPKGRY